MCDNYVVGQGHDMAVDSEDDTKGADKNAVAFSLPANTPVTTQQQAPVPCLATYIASYYYYR